MQLSIQQVKTNFNMAWEILDKDKRRYAYVDAPLKVGYFEADAFFRNHAPKKLYHNPSDKTFGNKLTERFNLKIFENGNEMVGSIVGSTQKIGFLKSYVYYKIDFRGVEYSAYEVGFGAKGLYLCIYKDDRLIAIIDKKLRVINYKDSYTCYLENEEDADVVLTFAIYYDMTSYGDFLQVSALSVSEKRVVTLQKELIKKYDSEFIPRIIVQDGYVL